MGLLHENENDDDNGRRKHEPMTPANAPMAAIPSSTNAGGIKIMRRWMSGATRLPST
jgi:hypothetical protein